MVVIVVAVLALPFVVGASRRRAASLPVALDMRRSFAVTDHAILDGFSFERVMNSLVERSGVPGMTATRLYQQWLDTQNPKPGLVAADAPHCDDFLIDGKPSFNGFPRHCPTREGAFATAKPFVPRQFIPLAIINRFDMTATDGSNCGQYRLIYARQSRGEGFSIPELLSNDTLHFIFEAVLPNPKPENGMAACRPVAQFWAELSAVGSIAERRARLEEFFFVGLPGFAPVVQPEHYSKATGGGIRSFHWTATAGGNPQFYQFRLEKTCDAAGCRLLMEPDVLQNTPLGKLFDAGSDTPEGRRFRDNFIEQVKTLAIEDVNRFFMDLPREFLVAESDPLGGLPNYIFHLPYFSGLITFEGQEFERRISAELKRIGSKFKPLEIIQRASSQTCFGCHVTAAGALPFPQPFNLFQHVNERAQEQGESGLRYSISPAMRDVFIPHRMEILRKFLAAGTLPVRSNAVGDATIGGGRAVQ